MQRRTGSAQGHTVLSSALPTFPGYLALWMIIVAPQGTQAGISQAADQAEPRSPPCHPADNLPEKYRGCSLQECPVFVSGWTDCPYPERWLSPSDRHGLKAQPWAPSVIRLFSFCLLGRAFYRIDPREQAEENPTHNTQHLEVWDYSPGRLERVLKTLCF